MKERKWRFVFFSISLFLFAYLHKYMTKVYKCYRVSVIGNCDSRSNLKEIKQGYNISAC